MKEKSGKRNPRGEIMEQVVWETFGKHFGSIWEAFRRHLRSIWETSGRHLAGVANRRKKMGEQCFIIRTSIFRKSSLEVLTLPGVLKVGVTKYNFLQ